MLKIVTAMPHVNPIVTGIGMKRINDPSRSAPIANMMVPASIVQISRFCSPYRAPTSATRPTNAPAGPPICTREPPSADTMKPPTMPV
ncbi:MAG: hypothetical protein NVV63_17320 [Opitutus sp.]|nr:hypothetical protein [Opitutus sp.]